MPMCKTPKACAKPFTALKRNGCTSKPSWVGFARFGSSVPAATQNYSWWDYRDRPSRRNRGLRIDHILVSHALRPLAQSCAVDKEPRKRTPSDRLVVR